MFMAILDLRDRTFEGFFQLGFGESGQKYDFSFDILCMEGTGYHLFFLGIGEDKIGSSEISGSIGYDGSFKFIKTYIKNIIEALKSKGRVEQGKFFYDGRYVEDGGDLKLYGTYHDFSVSYENVDNDGKWELKLVPKEP